MTLRVSSTVQELHELICAARTGDLEISDIAALTRDLAESGEMLTWEGDRIADVASTGGPTSLSTLLCPLFLTTLGWRIPKLGVPGRPAGGLDALSQIPGYRVHLSSTEVEAVIARCGYAHFAAGDQIAPLDARLFKLRQESAAQTVPALVTSSVLSKKLAVGVRTVGLEVRVATHGNFGSNLRTARENSKLFCSVASALEMHATCILTDASRPYQPFIGRAEALLALFRLFSVNAGHWLNRHLDQCSWMAAATVGLPPTPVTVGQLYNAFVSNVEAQGGSVDGFEETACNAADGHRYTVTAPRSGFPTVNLEQLRRVIVGRQKKAEGDREYPDPVGVILLVEDSQMVSVGDPLLTVRVESMKKQFISEVSACVVVSEHAPTVFGETVHG